MLLLHKIVTHAPALSRIFHQTNIFTFSNVNVYIPKKILLLVHYIIYGITMHNPVKMHVTHTRPRLSLLRLPWRRQLKRVYEMRDRPDDNFPAHQKKKPSINWLKWTYFFGNETICLLFNRHSHFTMHSACIISCIYDRKCCRRPLPVKRMLRTKFRRMNYNWMQHACDDDDVCVSAHWRARLDFLL